MLIQEFDFDLPPELIAQHPPERREDSRMMVVRRREGTIEHARFEDFPGRLGAGDLLVLNDTRVIPAKAWGKRGEADIEFLFVREIEPGVWEALCRPARKVRDGDRIVFAPGIEAVVAGEGAEGLRTLRFDRPDVLAGLRDDRLRSPPALHQAPQEPGAICGREDLERYQTVFARKDGAIAAPTAGLHFTPGVLAGGPEEAGSTVRKVTLEVGLATFQPVRAERVEDHRMLEERYEILPAAGPGDQRRESRGTARRRRRDDRRPDPRERRRRRPGPARQGRDVPVHPSRVRIQGRGPAPDEFPPAEIDASHARLGLRRPRPHPAGLPEAVRERYRFFSYGDCMLIL